MDSIDFVLHKIHKAKVRQKESVYRLDLASRMVQKCKNEAAASVWWRARTNWGKGRQNDWMRKYDEKLQQMEAKNLQHHQVFLVVVVMAVMMMTIKSCIWNAVYVFNGKNEDYNIMWINNGWNSPLFEMIMPNGIRPEREGREVKQKTRKENSLDMEHIHFVLIHLFQVNFQRHTHNAIIGKINATKFSTYFFLISPQKEQKSKSENRNEVYSKRYRKERGEVWAEVPNQSWSKATFSICTL